jgi:hypothetical protein
MTGGGYGLPIFPGNVIFFVQSQQKLAEKGKNVVLAFLEYGKFPSDIMQLIRNTANKTTYRPHSRDQISYTVCSRCASVAAHSQLGL